MIIFKDINESAEFELSIAKTAKSEKIIIGIFSDMRGLNDAYETVKATLRALGKKVQVIDNI